MAAVQHVDLKAPLEARAVGRDRELHIVDSQLERLRKPARQRLRNPIQRENRRAIHRPAAARLGVKIEIVSAPGLQSADRETRQAVGIIVIRQQLRGEGRHASVTDRHLPRKRQRDVRHRRAVGRQERAAAVIRCHGIPKIISRISINALSGIDVLNTNLCVDSDDDLRDQSPRTDQRNDQHGREA